MSLQPLTGIALIAASYGSYAKILQMAGAKNLVVNPGYRRPTLLRRQVTLVKLAPWLVEGTIGGS